MKTKIARLLLVVLGMNMMVALAGAAGSGPRTYQVPLNQFSQEADPMYGGCQHHSTPITNSVETLISSKTVVFYGLQMSTGAATSFAVVRDTDVLNGSSDALVFSRIAFATNPYDAFFAGKAIHPTRMFKGLSIQLGGTLAAGEWVNPCYLELER